MLNTYRYIYIYKYYVYILIIKLTFVHQLSRPCSVCGNVSLATHAAEELPLRPAGAARWTRGDRRRGGGGGGGVGGVSRAHSSKDHSSFRSLPGPRVRRDHPDHSRFTAAFRVQVIQSSPSFLRLLWVGVSYHGDSRRVNLAGPAGGLQVGLRDDPAPRCLSSHWFK